MRPSFVVFAAFVCAVAAQKPYSSGDASYPSSDRDYNRQDGSYAPESSYAGGDYANSESYSKRDLEYEMASARAFVNAEIPQTDQLNNIALDVFNQKVPINTRFREEFEAKIYPTILATLAENDKRIQAYRDQIDNLRSLSYDVENLSARIRSIRRSLSDIREGRANIRADIERAKNVNGRIEGVAAQITALDARLYDVSAQQQTNAQDTNDLVRNLRKVVDIVNGNNGEVFTFTLSKDYPTANFTYRVQFNTPPQITWAVVGFNAAPESGDYKSGGNYNNNNYGSNSNYDSNKNYDRNDNYNSAESLDFNIVASTDAKSGSVTLVDKSNNWKVDSVRVRVSALNIDTSIQKYEETPRKNSTYSAY